jgi:hypothetical protein
MLSFTQPPNFNALKSKIISLNAVCGKIYDTSLSAEFLGLKGIRTKAFGDGYFKSGRIDHLSHSGERREARGGERSCTWSTRSGSKAVELE